MLDKKEKKIIEEKFWYIARKIIPKKDFNGFVFRHIMKMKFIDEKKYNVYCQAIYKELEED